MSNKRMMYVYLFLICCAYVVTKCISVNNSTDVKINQKGGEPKIDMFEKTVNRADTVVVIEIDTVGVIRSADTLQ